MKYLFEVTLLHNKIKYKEQNKKKQKKKIAQKWPYHLRYPLGNPACKGIQIASTNNNMLVVQLMLSGDTVSYIFEFSL